MPSPVSWNPIKHLGWVSKSITTQSALSPLLWLSGITVPAFLFVAIFGQAAILTMALSLLGLPVVAAVVGFFVLVFRDPNRLHSEKFQLDARRLEMLGDSVSGRLEDEASRLTMNPHMEAVDDDSR